MLRSLLNALGGMVGLGGFAWAVLGLVRHRSAEASLDRGLRVWSRPLSAAEGAALARLPERSSGPWGWARREGAWFVLFADPYATADGMRVSTPWPYRAVARLDGEPRLEYRAPTGFLVLVGLALLPILPLLSWINHVAQVGRVERRLATLVHAA